MGRIIVLVLVFLGLGTLAVWKIKYSGKVEDTFANSLHTQFAIEDINQIQRVFLVDRDGNGGPAITPNGDRGSMVFGR